MLLHDVQVTVECMMYQVINSSNTSSTARSASQVATAPFLLMCLDAENYYGITLSLVLLIDAVNYKKVC